MLEYFVVSEVVLSIDAKVSSELRLLEPHQTCDAPTIESPGLRSVHKGGEDQ